MQVHAASICLCDNQGRAKRFTFVTSALFLLLEIGLPALLLAFAKGGRNTQIEVFPFKMLMIESFWIGKLSWGWKAADILLLSLPEPETNYGFRSLHFVFYSWTDMRDARHICWILSHVAEEKLPSKSWACFHLWMMSDDAMQMHVCLFYWLLHCDFCDWWAKFIWRLVFPWEYHDWM